MCAAHLGRIGAPAGNQNRLVHGLYAAPAKPIVTIDDAIESLGEQLARSSEFLANTDDPEIFLKVFNLHAQALSRFGRLLRDKRALSGESADALLDMVSKAADEIFTELGISL